MQLTLERDGAQLFPKLIASDLLSKLFAILSTLPDAPGIRIRQDPELDDWIARRSALTKLARSLRGPSAEPVRAILFDKTAAANWALGWHQDRSIAVRERVETTGFDNWTVKGGTPHVEPPFEILDRMITMRVHLDDVDQGNAPLLIVPGSHCVGRIVDGGIDALLENTRPFACEARAGDVWVYATAILHASESSRRACRRRVLQVDFSADRLPGALDWAGLA